jgi:hypothetical protein
MGPITSLFLILYGYGDGTYAPRALLVKLTIDVSIIPPPQVPVDLPFTLFCQEPIPLRQQYKELLEERQERLCQERQKQAQQQQKRPQNRRRSQPTTKYSPQPTTCRHCNKNFSSRNALFRHLNLCKTSRSHAFSVSSRESRASLVSSSLSSTLLISSSSNVSRISLTASLTSSATSASSTSAIMLIKKVQLKILSQLYVIRSQDLSFLHKNDPLYGLPQNRQLRKTTVTSPPKSTATVSIAIPSLQWNPTPLKLLQ